MMTSNQIKIRVNKNDLLNKLKENLINHVKLHTEALKTWQVKAAEFVATLPDKIRDGSISSLSQAIAKYDDRPVSYAPSYEKVIRMLEFCVDEVIELESEDFDRYVGDNWEWKHSFLTNSSKYGSRP